MKENIGESFKHFKDEYFDALWNKGTFLWTKEKGQETGE